MSLPPKVSAAIERLMRCSRTEGYAMGLGDTEAEAQAERNTNSAWLALEAAILAHLGRAALSEASREQTEEGV